MDTVIGKDTIAIVTMDMIIVQKVREPDIQGRQEDQDKGKAGLLQNQNQMQIFNKVCLQKLNLVK